MELELGDSFIDTTDRKYKRKHSHFSRLELLMIFVVMNMVVTNILLIVFVVKLRDYVGEIGTSLEPAISSLNNYIVKDLEILISVLKNFVLNVHIEQ
jgi:hypothetical protein